VGATGRALAATCAAGRRGVGGVPIPKGGILLAAIASANRDETVFAEPDRFDPDREQGELLTFGFGSKFCPGSHLARRQLLAALDVVLERLPDLRLVDADPPSGAILRRTEHLEVAWS
jgi:cytochrome P450